MERVLDKESGCWFWSWSATTYVPGQVTLKFLALVYFAFRTKMVRRSYNGKWCPLACPLWSLGNVYLERCTGDGGEPLPDSVDRKIGGKRATYLPSLNLTTSWVIICFCYDLFLIFNLKKCSLYTFIEDILKTWEQGDLVFKII